MDDQKPHCKAGESDSGIALGWAIVLSVIAIVAWVVFLWATRFINF